MRTTTPSGTRKVTTATGVGIATVALSLALVGCGSATKTDEKKAETTSSKTESATSSATTTSSKPEKSGLTSPETTGTHRTIQDYIKENNIQDTVINRGDPGPTIDLPVPDGWEVKPDFPRRPTVRLSTPRARSRAIRRASWRSSKSSPGTSIRRRSGAGTR